jgi:hypothetical protein
VRAKRPERRPSYVDDPESVAPVPVAANDVELHPIETGEVDLLRPGFSRSSSGIASFLALLLVLIAILALWRQDGSGAATWLQPDDLVRLSTVTLEPDIVRPAVSQDDALKIAKSLYDWDLMGGSTEVTAALALATDPDMARSDQPMTKRSVWIIHIDGVEQAVSGPWDPAR